MRVDYTAVYPNLRGGQKRGDGRDPLGAEVGLSQTRHQPALGPNRFLAARPRSNPRPSKGSSSWNGISSAVQDIPGTGAAYAVSVSSRRGKTLRKREGYKGTMNSYGSGAQDTVYRDARNRARLAGVSSMEGILSGDKVN